MRTIFKMAHIFKMFHVISGLFLFSKDYSGIIVFSTVASDYACTNLINYRQFVRQKPRFVAKENFFH